MRDLAKKAQKNYKTRLGIDKQNLDNGEYIDLNERNILQVRIEERIVLEDIIQFCDDMVDLLAERHLHTVEVSYLSFIP